MAPIFKYYLRKDDTTYYEVVNGSVLPTTNKNDIGSGAVKNWDDIQLQWVRHDRYYGIMKKQSTEIHFCNDAAKIVRHCFANGGTMGACYFDIEAYDNIAKTYSLFYSGAIDFATYDSFRDYVQVGIMQGDLSAYIDARENQLYDIKIEDADCVNVRMDGILLNTRYRYLVAQATGSTLENPAFVRLTPLMIYVRQEGDFSVGYGSNINNPLLFPEPPLFEADYQTDIFIQYIFDITHTPRLTNNGYTLKIEHWDGQPGTGVKIADHILFDSGITTVNVARRNAFSGGLSITLAAGDSIALTMNLKDQGAPATSNTRRCDYVFNNDDVFLINCTTSSVPAGSSNEGLNVKGHRVHQQVSKLLNKVTDGKYTLRAGYLTNPNLPEIQHYDAIPYKTIITSEQALKGITEEFYIQDSLDKIRQHILSVHGAGFGIENNQLVAEKLDYFFNPALEICRINSTNGDPEFVPAPQFILNTLEIGYGDIDAIDDLNKRNAFNTAHQYQYSNLRLLDKNTNKQDLISSYSTECNFIEVTRANNYDSSGKPRINNTQKNEAGRTFAVYVDQYDAAAKQWLLDRKGIVKGVDYPNSVYNVALSPKRCLLRLIRMLKGIAAMWPDKILKFTSTELNRNLQANLTVGNIVECTDVDLGATPGGKALFLPVVMKVNVPVPADFGQSMDTKPYGYITIPYRGYDYKGFVLLAGINKGKNKTMDFELLMHPDTDPTKLIF